MKKAIMGLVILAILVISVSVVVAQPGPGKAKGKNPNIGHPDGEPWVLLLDTGKGGHQTWRPIGDISKHHVYICNVQDEAIPSLLADGWRPSSYFTDPRCYWHMNEIGS